MANKSHNFASFMQKTTSQLCFLIKISYLCRQNGNSQIIIGTKRNTSKMIKETISPVQNAGKRMSPEEKPWFNHSQMIANIMSARMKELGMTQKMLAEKMNCTQQYISKILKGRENLSLEAISKIENALDVHFLQMDE